MNTRAFKLGDRVRVTARYRGEVYRPGDQGTVSWVAQMTPDVASVQYHVTMDRNGPAGTAVIFAAEEIEPDV